MTQTTMQSSRPTVPAVFLDKDGALLDDVPFNVDPSRMRFAPRVQTGLRLLAQLDVPLIVITNQPGIAYGMFEPSALDAVERELSRMFGICGAQLTGFFACPHHPMGEVAEYTCNCLCRMPMPGLLRRAAAKHHIDLASSWFIGDVLDDIEAGHRAGCRSILIDNGNETEWTVDTRTRTLRRPDRVARDLDVAARIVRELLGPGRGPTRGAPKMARLAFSGVSETTGPAS